VAYVVAITANVHGIYINFVLRCIADYKTFMGVFTVCYTCFSFTR